MSKFRTLQRTLALSGATLALATTGALGTAHAADGDSDTSSPASVGSEVTGDKVVIESLPSCIDVINHQRAVYVYNWCSTKKFVKVYWSFGSDSACTGLEPNYVMTSKRSFPARFDAVKLCA
ncbi:hypothetical protein AB0J38_30925 [Streptomyces sp. NPDC050095]|uniref:hypothetical protein n=1 Tax=unclassified Streptomyces TaxID=2593676 RepID=UPI003424FDDB